MFSTDNFDNGQSSNDGEYTNITLHDHFIDNILQVVKVMEVLLVGLLTQRRAVVISIAIVKQLTLFTVEEETKFTHRCEVGYYLIDPHYKI